MGGLALILGGSSTTWADYASKGKRDPFVPLLTADGQRLHPPGLDEEAETVIGALVLEGIVFDPRSESYAVINGRIVREEEELNGMKILKIESTAVTVLVEGQTHRLSVHQPKEEEQKQ